MPFYGGFWGYGYGWGRGWGRGRGWGGGWGRGNPYPFCRAFPWLPRGWWAMPWAAQYGAPFTGYPGYASYPGYGAYPYYGAAYPYTYPASTANAPVRTQQS